MAIGVLGGTLRHLRDLFHDGSSVGLGDGQLLARYVDDRDEAAFEALVARHGPMVLATCRTILKGEHDVEDAFQATFLVLARTARSVRAGDALGGWLHRIAYRAAVHAQRDARRRRRREAEAMATATLKATHTAPDPESEIASIVHEELDRLPDGQRLPVVLCDLEGLSYEQAAGRLRWTEPTLRHRLVKGRRRLRERLTRRGVTVGATGAVLAVSAAGARAAVPAALARAAVVAATGGASTATAAALTVTIIRSLSATRLMLVATAALAAAALVSIGVVAIGAARRDEPGPALKAPGAVQKPPAVAGDAEDQSGAVIPVRGRVIAPDGRPVPGATLQIAYADPVGPAATTSGPDGRFALRVPRSVRGAPVLLNGYDEFPWLVATAPGFGPGWVRGLFKAADSGELTVRLVEDGPPIEGRIVDLEGRPVDGARVKAVSLYAAPGGDLVAWFAPDKDRRSAKLLGDLELLPATITAAVTDHDGRFHLAGIGRERSARLAISGPTIATTELYAMNRDAEIRVRDEPRTPGGSVVIHPRRFEYAAAPTKPVEGVIRDQDTGRPIAGMTLHAAAVDDPRALAPIAGIEAVTDAQGRYRLIGLPKSSAYRLAVEQAEGKPYPRTSYRVRAGTPAFEPVRFDIALERGVLIRGRVTDKATGRPVPGYINAFTFRDNPAIKGFPGYNDYNNLATIFIKADGRYEAVGLPGRNVLACRSEMRRYRGTVGAEAIAGYDPRRMALDTLPLNCYVNNYHVLAEVDIDPKAESATLDLQLDPGRSVTVDVVDPDGRPVVGTKVKGVTDLFSDAIEYDQPSPTIEIHALDPSKPRRVIVTHAGRHLIGTAYLTGNEASPSTLRLLPWGTITGRVVDDDGEPRPRVSLMSIDGSFPKRPAVQGILTGDVVTNSAGRFRVDRLVPGLEYGATVSGGNAGPVVLFRDVTVAPGVVKDLGDLKVLPPGRAD